MRSSLAIGAAALSLLATIGLGCAGESAEQPSTPARDLAPAQIEERLSLTRVRAHLSALQRLADRHGGNRAAGTAGYAASVRYVRDQLARVGYRPRVAGFAFVSYGELREKGRQVAPVRRALTVEAIDYSPSTPKGGLRGRVVASGDGCEPSDFGDVRGAVALVTRGVCFISVKARNAQAAGARAVLTYNLQPGPLNATLGDPQASRIPVAAITRSAGTQLARTAGAVVELELTTSRRPSRSQNVLADTRPGAPRVLLAGAHLDSVIAGPGINDNGTGVAVLLEVARVLRASAPQVNVRFGFWSAEELGLIGSRAYAQTLRPGSVAGYLNFDMLGSPTRAYGVYAAGPYTERWLEYFERRGLPAQRVDLAGRSDHFAFEQAGIPTGGLIAGEYACYHSACDRLGAVDTSALRDLARAAAYGIAAFAPRS